MSGPGTGAPAPPATSVERSAAVGAPVGGAGRPNFLRGTEGSLRRYRVMAIIVGTGLAVLCFVGIPLQVAGWLVTGHDRMPWKAVVAIVGPVHGIAYIIYLVSCLDLAGRARFRTLQLVGMVLSGLLPLLAFYMERKVVQRVEAQLAQGTAAPPGPAATIWSVISGRARAEADAELPGDESDGGGHGDGAALP